MQNNLDMQTIQTGHGLSPAVAQAGRPPGTPASGGSAGDALSSVVAEAGARLKWSGLLVGACIWLAVCLGLWLLLFVADTLVSLPAGLRLPLALGGAAFSGVCLFRKVLKLAFQRQTPERTALLLEHRYGIRENLLINAVQFQRQVLRPEELAFAERTINASTSFAQRVHFADLWDWPGLRLWGMLAGTVVLLWLAFIALFPRQFGASTQRYLLPLSDVPPPGALSLKLAPAKDIVLAEGENLEVQLEIQAPKGRMPAKPPLLVWQEKTDFIQPVHPGGESAPMDPESSPQDPDAGEGAAGGGPRKFGHTFPNVQAPFAFRVFAGDSYTRSVRVDVRPTPRLKDSVFRITPPAYTGQKQQTIPGPPAPLAALPNSLVEVAFTLEPAIRAADWQCGGNPVPFKRSGGRWSAEFTLTNAGSYEIRTTHASGGNLLTLARGDVQLLTDNPPEVDFITQDRNRLVQFGETLKLTVQARDDFGLAEISVVSRPVEREDAVTVHKRWTYLGPPGNPGPVREDLSLIVDVRSFEAGASCYLEALANDFRPGGVPSRSRPIILRIKSEQDMVMRDDDPLAPAFNSLKQAAAAQEKAARLTANLITYLDEILKKRTLQDQAGALSAPQREAERCARDALDQFKQKPEGKAFAAPLASLVNNDMKAVLLALGNLSRLAKNDLAANAEQIRRSQTRILEELLGLLGQVADARSEKLKPVSEGKDTPQPPALAREERAKEALEDVKHFVAAEERVLEKSRTLADKGPEDLTQQEQENLGELAREEEKWAKFFEEKLTDFSKLPNQDFADSSMAEEFNQVFQEVQKAADALTQKKIELAVPHEQSGLENAKELVNNLERWLPDAPDNIKWSMEEPLAPADIAMAELPKELEDIVGELLDTEQAMTPDVQDVTSSWMDSADKGAGWGASDGPISDMSAKGVTGNLLPNQNEVAGRSAEGRTGRSHGQMVADTAEGKGGQETPTRLTPGPFEQGSVKDSARQDKGGATGGGKLSGFTGEGLRGPTAPPGNQTMPRLAEQQAKLRQKAEALALKLRRYRVPGGGLETSITAMSQLEQSARKNDGLGVRRSFSRAVDSLAEAKNAVHNEAVVRREQNKLPAWMRDEIRVGVQDGVPKGYEEMVGEYFRALAEGRKE